MTAACYVCGTLELAADADLRNPVCDRCKPAREHVVSMELWPGGIARALCGCGWRHEATGEDRFIDRDAAVLSHWRSLIDETEALRELSREFCDIWHFRLSEALGAAYRRGRATTLAIANAPLTPDTTLKART